MSPEEREKRGVDWVRAGFMWAALSVVLTRKKERKSRLLYIVLVKFLLFV